MGLNIVTSNDPLNVETIITLIYGDPGIWKTSLAFTAKRPILFDFDEGAYRAINRGDSVQINDWSEVARFSASDLANYDTIIVDTAGRALDLITTMLKRNSGNTRKDGQLSQQGYGKLGGIFTDWLKMLRGMGKDIVLLAHTSEDKDGDIVIKRPDMIGGSKREAYKIADMMGYLTTQHSNEGDVKMLSFVQSANHLAKDSGLVGNIVIKPVTDEPTQLGDIIQQTKDRLNGFSAAAWEAHKDLDAVRVKVMNIENAKDVNALVKSLVPTHVFYERMKREVWSAVKPMEKIDFDKEKKIFFDVDDDVEADMSAPAPQQQDESVVETQQPMADSQQLEEQ